MKFKDNNKKFAAFGLHFVSGLLVSDDVGDNDRESLFFYSFQESYTTI